MKKRLLRYVNKVVKPKYINYNGVKLKIDNNLISKHIQSIIYNYSYEREEIVVLNNILSYDDIVMEVGAGMGFLSCFCKMRNSKVIAYEANPNMIPLIKENYLLNGVTSIIKNVILSDRNGEIDFYLEDNFYSSSTIKRTNQSQSIKIKTININDEIQEFNPSLLIVDIEGGEKDLIKYINFQNNNISKVLIELHPHIIGDKDVNNVIKYLFNNNFLLDTTLSGNCVYYFYRDLI